MIWLFLYLANIAIAIIFENFFARHGHQVSENIRLFFFIMNLGVSSLVVFVFASNFITSAVRERAKADRLLLNILPPKTAQILKSRPGVIAEEYDNASVLFADIVDFTNYSSLVRPDQLVTKLNEFFLRFDELTSRHGLEKIKTIGDAYMVISGVPEPKANHTQAIADLALDMLSTIKGIKKRTVNLFLSASAFTQDPSSPASSEKINLLMACGATP